MKAVLAEMAAVAGAILLATTVRGLGRDDGVLVPPPEAVSENLVKAMTEHRYAQARQHVTKDLARTDPGSLAVIVRGIEQVNGAVETVQGEDAVVSGEESTARVALEFERGRRDLHLPLRREKGLWKVASLDPLREMAAPARPGP